MIGSGGLSLVVFIALGAILAMTDLCFRRIPNIIVIPGIIVGIWLTGNWHWALTMFWMGAYIFYNKYWAGGDVKLIAMVGAFLGWIAFPIFCISIIFMELRRLRKQRSQPYAPFAFVVSLIFAITDQVIGRCLP